MNFKNNIWKLYAYRILQNLVPAYVIERLFWEQRGMTIQLVVYTEIIYAVTIVLLEIPTGIIADMWSRKKMMVISAILGYFEFLILLFATEFWHFAVVVFLAGVAQSVSSGSENALLYDSLLLCDQEDSFEKYLGRLNIFGFTSAMAAALCGSFLASRYGFELTYWLSFASSCTALVVSFWLAEPTVKSELDEPIAIQEYVRASLSFFKNNQAVCLVVLTGMVTGAAINFIDEFWQLYLSELEIPVIYFGLFSALFMLLRVPGNMLVEVLKNKFSYRSLLLGVTAVFAGGFFYLSIVHDFSSLAAICLIFLVSGVTDPLASGYLHHRIDSSMRATMDSFQSLGLNAVTMLTGLGFGFFSSRFNIFGGYGFIAFICGLFFVYFLWAFFSERSNIQDERR
ncbi:MFS transporter [Paenibacillus psychroresistens]|uniref:MFS transporter n=1 Tax=Paenibacillus psychroresistens TaxID=1778678 RepID=A0A6B8RQG8_9BACL|nr:MFS transporter [Paenibacillus psychroresistens]QGQ98087.1 MFS transporter [Paenibacillus psychroresistens]